MVVHQDIGMNFSIVSVRHLAQGIQKNKAVFIVCHDCFSFIPP